MTAQVSGRFRHRAPGPARRGRARQLQPGDDRPHRLWPALL